MLFNLNDVVEFYETPNDQLIKAGGDYEFKIEHLKSEVEKMKEYKDQILVRMPLSQYLEELEKLESAIRNFTNIVNIISMSGLPDEEAFKFSVNNTKH